MGASENDDWWVYEETGKLIHTQGDNKPRYFQNCTKIGEDGIFGEAGTEIENRDNNADGFSQTALSVEDSENIAAKGGYKKVAKTVLRSESTLTSESQGPKGTLDVTSTNTVEVVESYMYTEKENIQIDSKIIGDPLKFTPPIGPGNSEYISRRDLIYGEKTIRQKFFEILITINNTNSGNLSTSPKINRYPNYNSLPKSFEYLKKYQKR